jgi:competence protein ComEC
MSLGILALAWLLGIAAASFTGADPAAALAASGLLGAVSFARRPQPWTLVLIAVGSLLIFAAAWRYDSTGPPALEQTIGRLNDGTARFRGLVDSEPEPQGASVLYRVDVREVFERGRWHEDSGRVLVRGPAHPRYEYGDLLEIEGELQNPPVFDGFDYREYLLRRGVVSLTNYPEMRLLDEGHGSAFRSAIIGLRSRLAQGISDSLPEPEASLATGILLGSRAQLPPDLRQDMNTTSTSHMVAVSGQNVTMIAALIIAMLTGVIGRRSAAWLALTAIAGYALLIGGQPSVVRGAIMGALYVISIATGRQNTALIALALAGAVMTGLNPHVAHDVSFQLSFAATLGLILLAPALSNLAHRALAAHPDTLHFPGARTGIEVTAMTLAATVFTLPITAMNFERVSLVAPLANLFAVPAFVLVAISSAVVAIAENLIPGSGWLLSWVAWPPTAYMLAVIRFFARFPAAAVEVDDINIAHAIPYYVIIGPAALALSTNRLPALLPPLPSLPPTARRPLVPTAALAALLMLASVLLWLAITAPEQGRLSVTFLDVGQGDAILIEGPHGHRILIDGGPSEEALNSALGRNLPFYGRRIDLVVLTHPQSDHLGGLPAALRGYSVGGVLANPFETNTASYDVWLEALERASVPVVAAARGQRVELGEGVAVTILHPPPSLEMEPGADLNDASVVAMVTMGSVSILLTGDIGETAESALLRSGWDLSATVLKVPHHGSRFSSTEPFLVRVRPMLNVISVGHTNPFGHPAPETLQRLEDGLVLRTDRHGDVKITTDGERIWVETQKTSPQE